MKTVHLSHMVVGATHHGDFSDSAVFFVSFWGGLFSLVLCCDVRVVKHLFYGNDNFGHWTVLSPLPSLTSPLFQCSTCGCQLNNDLFGHSCLADLFSVYKCGLFFGTIFFSFLSHTGVYI